MENSKYYKITEAPLEEKEKKKLRLGLMAMPIFFVFVGVFATIMITVFDMTWEDEFFKFFLAFLVIFIGIIFLVIRNIIQDLGSGMKQVIRGIVTDKKHEVYTRSKGTSKHYYYLHFEDFALKVEHGHYNKSSIGDMVEVHYGNRSGIIFSHEVLKENAKAELEEQGIQLPEPKKVKDNWPAWKMAVLISFIVVLFFGGIFWLVADCFNCDPEYPPSVSGWQTYESSYDGSNMLESDVHRIISYLNDTLKDSEEEQIISIFQRYSEQGATGDLIMELDSTLFADSLTSRQWLREKFDEGSPDDPLTVFDIFRSTLFAITGSDSFRPKSADDNDKFHIWDVNYAILADQALSYDAVKTWFGKDRGIRQMQYVVYNYLPKDTADYSVGVNKLFREVISHSNQMNASDVSKLNHCRSVYGMD